MISTKGHDQRPTAADLSLISTQGLNMVATQSGNPDLPPATLLRHAHGIIESERGRKYPEEVITSSRTTTSRSQVVLLVTHICQELTLFC